MIADIPSQILSSIGLQKPNGRGRVPRQRLKSAEDAAAIVALLLHADRDRALALTRVKGMLDGNAPFSHGDLVKHGQANRCNVNFREGEGALSMACAPYYDLFAESSTYCQIEVDEKDQYRRSEWSRIITAHFDDMLKDWSGFDWNIQRMIHDMVAFGRGYCVWTDPINWQFCAIQQSKVLVPDGTPSDVDQLEILIVRQSITVSDLYCKIRNEEVAVKMGWNINATYAAMARAQPERRNDLATLDYERIQEEIRNHDLYESIRSDVVRLAHIYVREFNGKVSHYIVEESRALNWKADQKGIKPEFLYQRIAKYGCFRAVLCPFFYDIGEGTWHSIKGLGLKQYPFMEIKNRLTCSLVDNAFLNMSILLQPTSGRSEQETALIHLGPLTLLPANYELRQWAIAGRMEEGLVIERALTQKLESNIGQYRGLKGREKGNPATATQIEYDAAREASLNRSDVNRFYTQLDHLFEQIFIRATNLNLEYENEGRGPNTAALNFQKKCLEDGIPRKALKNYRFVRATRNSGNGSVFLRQQTVSQTAQLVPMMNEAGKQNWLDDSIAVLAGSENVTRWNPKQQLHPDLENQQAYAIIENGTLADGAPVMVTSTQNHVIHATTHMKAATDSINSIPQGGDSMKVLAFLEGIGPHIAEHIQRLAGDPMRGKETRILGEQLKQLGQVSDQLKRQVMQARQKQQREMQRLQQEMSQQQQKTRQVLTDEQLRQLEVQNKINLSRQKADSNMELRRQVHEQRMRIHELESAQDRAIQDAMAATDIRTKTAKASADVANKQGGLNSNVDMKPMAE